MKRSRIGTIIAAAVAALLLAGCNNIFQGLVGDSEESGTDTSSEAGSDSSPDEPAAGTVTVTLGGAGTQSIIPDVQTTVASYAVTLSRDGYEDHSTTAASGPFEFTDVASGQWNVTVDALDSTDSVVAKGSDTIDVQVDGTNSVSVAVSATQNGTGSIDLTVTWPAGDIDGVEAATLTPQGGSAIDIAADIAVSGSPADQAAYTDTRSSGIYTLNLRLSRNGFPVATVVEAVHIYDNVTTAQTIDLQSSEIRQAPSDPANLSATATGATTVAVSWTDQSTDEEGFELQRKIDGSGDAFQEIATPDADVTTFDDGGLTSETTYRYRLRATNTAGTSSWSTEATATTPDVTAPDPPTISGVTSGTHASAQSFTVTDTESGAFVEYSTDGGTSWTEYTAEVTLSAEGDYDITARQTDEAGNPSGSADLVTILIFFPPQLESVTAQSDARISVQWTDESGREDHYKIERSPDATEGSWTETGTETANVTNHDDTGLDSNTQYYYRVRAVDSGGAESAASSAISATTDALTAPSVSATALNADQIELSVTDSNEGTASYDFQRRPEGGTGADITPSQQDTTTYTDSGLLSQSTYEYRLRAVDSAGTASNWSSWTDSAASATTDQLAAPSGFSASPSAPNIELNWTDESDFEDEYHVYRRPGTSGTFEQIDTLNADVTNYQDDRDGDGFVYETTYQYEVRASDGGGTSPAVDVEHTTATVGYRGPAGGLIFYDDEDDDSDYIAGARYLEAAPASTEWTGIEWGGDGTDINGNDANAAPELDGVGNGQANTTAIVNALGTNGGTDYAAKLADDLDHNGFTDWFLPSKDELDLIYQNLHQQGNGGFANENYWSSSENNGDSAWIRGFSSGFQTDVGKFNDERVRAARTFSATAPKEPGTAETFNPGTESFDMHYVPPKSFPTGSDDSGTSSVANAFWIAQTEVTYGLWSEVHSWATSNGYSFANVGIQGNDGNQTDQHPVTTINWRDAMIWTNALTEYHNAQTGGSLEPVYYTDSGYTAPFRSVTDDSSISDALGEEDNPYVKHEANGFRLPTMGEWELAARYKEDWNGDWDIEDSGEYYPGDYASGATADYHDTTATGNVAWYNNNSGSRTHSVAQKIANALGLHDMSGNVWEWTFDWYPGQEGSRRYFRGGGFGSDADSLQVWSGGTSNPYYEFYDLGFRAARNAE